MPDRLLLIALLALAALAEARHARAAPPPRQSTAELRSAVQAHLARETQGLPGLVSFSVGRIDPRLQLPACSAPQTFVPAGALPWGVSTVGVRCADPVWSIRVPVVVHVRIRYAVAARPLAAGQPLAAADLDFATGDLAQLPAGVVTRSGQAIGSSPAVSLAAGQPLRRDMLRAPLAVQPGQAVRVVMRGKGFEISANGQALAGGPAGRLVRVRMTSGRVVSGIARPGAVVELPAGG